LNAFIHHSFTYSQPTGDPTALFWPYNIKLKLNVAEFALDKRGKVAGFRLCGGVWEAAQFVGEPKRLTVEVRSEVWYKVNVLSRSTNLIG
jgi:hypothetical protein